MELGSGISLWRKQIAAKTYQVLGARLVNEFLLLPKSFKGDPDLSEDDFILAAKIDKLLPA